VAEKGRSFLDRFRNEEQDYWGRQCKANSSTDSSKTAAKSGADSFMGLDAYTENGFISGEELVDTVSGIRKVAAVYKRLSDLLGVRASIITAIG
jgi:expansin (peptidoglycan-binding protein)